MSVVNRILQEDPDAFYTLTGASPYVDRSRRRLANLTPTGTRLAVSPLRGLSESLLTSTLTTFTIHKTPSSAFTMFAWVKQTVANQTHILSFHGNETEGLWQNGNQLNFGIRHIGGTFTTATAEIDGSRGHLMFGVFDGSQVILYVDGVEVANKAVTTTAAPDLDNILVYGEPSGVAVGMLGIFHRALSGATIAAIQQTATKVNMRTSTLSGFSAIDLRMQSEISDFNTYVFDAADPALVTNVNLENNTISAAYDGTLTSLSGNVRFAAPFIDSTNGFRVSWADSSGATVKYSTDGTTYTALYNGQTILAGTTVTSQPMFEVSFPAASTANMYLTDLRVDQILSTTLIPAMSNGRAVTTSGSVSLSADSDFRNYASLPATFGTNGTITIAPETEDASILTNAVEFWYTPVAADLTGTKVLMDNTPVGNYIYFTAGKIVYNAFSAFYVNETSVATNTYTLVPGVPVHIVAVYGTPNNDAIKLGWTSNPAAGNLASVALIRQTISAGQVVTLNDGQQDVPVSTLASNSGVNLTDTSVATYALVWTEGAQ